MNVIDKTKNKINEMKKNYGNGCTGVPDFNFRSCCDKHDEGYSLKDKWRITYDWEFFKCIKNKRKSVIIASVYFTGVRVLGLYWWFKAKK